MYCRLSTCLPVVQVTGPRSDFVCRRAAGNDATEGVCVCAGQDTTHSKTHSQSSQLWMESISLRRWRGSWKFLSGSDRKLQPVRGCSTGTMHPCTRPTTSPSSWPKTISEPCSTLPTARIWLLPTIFFFGDWRVTWLVCLSPQRPSRRSWNGCYGVSAKTSLPKPSRGGYIGMKSA